jgi:hypothetical protein
LQLLILAMIRKLESTFDMLLVELNLKGIMKLFKKNLNDGHRNKIRK